MRALLVIILCGAANAFAQSTSSLTDNTVVNAGSSQVQNVNGTGNTQALSLSGGNAPAQLPLTTTTPQYPSPNIFGPLGSTPGSASVPFVAAANRLCGVKYTRKYLPSAKPYEETESGQTRIIFSPYPSLLSKKGSAVVVEEMDPPDLTASTYRNVVCLGTITLMTKESAGNSTDFAVVQSDAMHFLFKEVQGYRKVALVSLIHSVSAASGVSTDGWSLGVGGALGHIVSALTSAGIAPTFSKGGGKTNPTNFPGGTFLVLATEEEGGQTVDMAALREFFTPYQFQPVVVAPPVSAITK